jgi:hypothetical protein
VLLEKGRNARETDELHRQMEVELRTLQSRHKQVEEQLGRV